MGSSLSNWCMWAELFSSKGGKMHVLIVFRVFLTLPRGLRGDQRLPEVGEYPLESRSARPLAIFPLQVYAGQAI